MSSAAILSAGPSINQTWNHRLHDEYPITIGINAAPKADCVLRVDWWCYLDPPTAYQCWHGKPVGGVMTSFEGIAQLRRGDTKMPADLPAIDGGKVANTTPDDLFKAYTITFAMILCRDLGCKTVDVYGADMMGQHEHNGRRVPAIDETWRADERPGQVEALRRLTGRDIRGDDIITRWDRERVEVDAMATWLHHFHGMTFTFKGAE